VKLSYLRRIHFYETDAMGIVHHARYLYLFEEARLNFFREKKILADHTLEQINYPLLESQVSYKKPLYFDDEVEILLNVQTDKLRLYFEYEIQTKRYPEIAAFGKTIHVAMDMKTRKPIRLPASLKDIK
jgi:acyl-CoA thioester hydrolase